MNGNRRAIISGLLVNLTGRLDSSFEDRNEDLVQSLLARHPTVGSFEMETFQLLHLARLCRKSTVHATAASIVVRGGKFSRFVTQFDPRKKDVLQEAEDFGQLILPYVKRSVRFYPVWKQVRRHKSPTCRTRKQAIKQSRLVSCVRSIICSQIKPQPRPNASVSRCCCLPPSPRPSARQSGCG